MDKKGLNDISVSGKRVLVRVDFNVPLKKAFVSDNTRIMGALPTINYLLKNNAKIILMSHLGRPKNQDDKEFSLEPVAKELGRILERKVSFSNSCVGAEVLSEVNKLKEGDILLLENLRFHKEEKENDENFSKNLAQYGDVYVNDAFGTAHRAHASTHGVTKYFDSEKCVAGFLLEKEIRFLKNELDGAKKPFVVILGGAKVSDKIAVIRALIPKADCIIIGGAMAFTFLKAKGIPVGNSLVEDNRLELANELLLEAKNENTEILLPVDAVMADKFSEDAKFAQTGIFSKENGVKDGWMGLDIGLESVKLFSSHIDKAQTIVWNGPMGVFEYKNFESGTLGVANAVAKSAALSIIGGGDSVSAIKKFGLEDQVSFISTGGGASLELLEGKNLPAIEALSEKNSDLEQQKYYDRLDEIDTKNLDISKKDIQRVFKAGIANMAFILWPFLILVFFVFYSCLNDYRKGKDLRSEKRLEFNKLLNNSNQ